MHGAYASPSAGCAAPVAQQRAAAPLTHAPAAVPCAACATRVQYPPFVMPVPSVDENGDVLSLDSLHAALVAMNQSIPASPDIISGFDVEFSQLILKRMLGFDLEYVKFNSYVEFYLGLREGKCDVAITAAELEVERGVCDANCPAVPANGFDFSGADYEDDWTEALRDSICCLEFGAPYLSQGFSLVSQISSKKLNPIDLIFSPELANVGLTIFIMIFTAGWLICFFEYRYGMENVGHGVYWSITTMTSVGYGDLVPRSHLGRLLASLWMLTSMMLISIFTSILSAQFTTARIVSVPVDSLAMVKGTLCVEPDYPAVQEFVQRSPKRPSNIVEAELDACFDKLVADDVQSVLTDRPIISWFVDVYDMPSLYVSPVLKNNPFSFVYRHNSPLRAVVNPAVIASFTDPQWIAQAEQIKSTYMFQDEALRGTAPAATDTGESLDRKVLAAAVTLACATGVATLFADRREIRDEARDATAAFKRLLKGSSAAALAAGKQGGAEGASAGGVSRAAHLQAQADGHANEATQLRELADMAQHLLTRLRALEHKIETTKFTESHDAAPQANEAA